MAATQSRPSQTQPNRTGNAQRKPRKDTPPPKPLQTLVFDSVGDRKYALQVGRARNDNPYIKLVEGVPQGDGTFRRFSICVWSEDWQSFFAAIDELRDYIRDNDLRTPENHKYDPNKPRGRKGGGKAAGNAS